MDLFYFIKADLFSPIDGNQELVEIGNTVSDEVNKPHEVTHEVNKPREVNKPLGTWNFKDFLCFPGKGVKTD